MFTLLFFFFTFFQMRFLDCREGRKDPSKSILDVGVKEAICFSGFDETMFLKRGGKYVWSKADMKLEWWKFAFFISSFCTVYECLCLCVCYIYNEYTIYACWRMFKTDRSDRFLQKKKVGFYFCQHTALSSYHEKPFSSIMTSLTILAWDEKVMWKTYYKLLSFACLQLQHAL